MAERYYDPNDNSRGGNGRGRRGSSFRREDEGYQQSRQQRSMSQTQYSSSFGQSSLPTRQQSNQPQRQSQPKRQQRQPYSQQPHPFSPKEGQSNRSRGQGARQQRTYSQPSGLTSSRSSNEEIESEPSKLSVSSLQTSLEELEELEEFKTKTPRKHDLQVLNLPKRPATFIHHSGKQIQILANHFNFKIEHSVIYQYTVSIEPSVEGKSLQYKLLEAHKEILGEGYIFDGSMLFLQKCIDDCELETISKLNTYKISIKKTTEIHPGGTAPLQLYNMIFRKILRLMKLKQLGRHYFDPKRPIQIPKHKVELWPGYFTSISPNERGTMLIADISHKVLRTDTVLDYLNSIRGSRNWHAIAEKDLISKIVLTRYNNRTYRIDEIAWDSNPQSKFKKRSGDELTFAEYYTIAYNKSLNDMTQPLLVHRHHRKTLQDEIIFLIPELCTMTGLSEDMRSDYHVMSDVAQHTRVLPHNRGKELEDFVSGMKDLENVQKELQLWGMSIDPKMLSVDGYLFDPERIFFGANKAVSVDQRSAEWSKEFRNTRLLAPMSLSNWMLVYSSRDRAVAQNISPSLKQVAQGVGVLINDPYVIELDDDHANSFTNSIRSNISPNQTQCIICILPNQKKERYDAIKKLCSLELGIPSQCVVARSLQKGKGVLSVCSKILLQINCKLGGELWKLNIPLQKTMIIGVDVCHDTSRGKQSVVGFCATMNDSFTKYYSRVSFQRTGQELIDGLKVCVFAALKQFFALNQSLPSLIIVFRDGVGDGMLSAVVDHEIPQINETFSQLNNYKPSLTFIVVKKRIHTRLFFPFNNSLQNPPPGTLVDSGCVNPGWYDFFLVSQSVRQGSVTPTHYHVVYDTSGIQPEHVQLLTFKMCHLYFNWPGTIRVPAPCQYAHKIAFLVGQSLHHEPHQDLSNSLHYL